MMMSVPEKILEIRWPTTLLRSLRHEGHWSKRLVAYHCNHINEWLETKYSVIFLINVVTVSTTVGMSLIRITNLWETDKGSSDLSSE